MVKYKGDIMKTDMDLPEIDLFSYLWKKLIFLKFCEKEIGQKTKLSPKKLHLGSIKSKKRDKIEFAEFNSTLLQLKSISNYIKYKIRKMCSF